MDRPNELFPTDDIPLATAPGDDDLVAALAAAPWHQSPGYARKRDGGLVGPHQYMKPDERPDLTDRVIARLATNIGVWRGCYKMRPFRYRYLTLSDGWTYWSMPSPAGPFINRARITRADRPCP